MRKSIFIVITALTILTLIPIPSLSGSDPHQASSGPVEFAVQEIQRLRALWTPEMYASVYGVYKIAAPFVRAGGVYLLLESPRLAVELISGGFIKAGVSVGKDALLAMIDKLVKSPKEVCRGISKEVIDKGWEDYKKAYSIVSQYRKIKTLSRAQAMEFLRCRLGAAKMGLARILNEDISIARYSPIGQASDAVTEEILEMFTDTYQRFIGLDDGLPLSQVAFFIRDATAVLEEKKAGLMSYPPYLKFTKNMDSIDRQVLEELKTFGLETPLISSPPPQIEETPSGPVRKPVPSPAPSKPARVEVADVPSSGQRGIFFDDFESGGAGGWREVEPTVHLSSGNPKNGGNSLMLADDTSKTAYVLLRLNTNSPRVGIEFWEWTNDFGYNGGTIYHLETGNESGDGWCFMFGAQVYSDGFWRYIDEQDRRILDARNPFWDSDRDFPIRVMAEKNTWHKIRLELYGPEGKARFWYDGDYKGEVSMTPTTRPILEFRHYVGWSSPTSTMNYIDDFQAYVPEPYR